MKEKYKYVFFKKIYDQIKLNELDQKLEAKKIKGINNKNDISKYFCLMNDVYEEQLPQNYKNQYENLFSLSIEQLESDSMKNEVDSFLENTYKYVLFKNIEEKYLYYGPINDKYIAPTDSIVLGLCYEEFDLDEEEFDELYQQQEDFVCDVCNYIQYTLAKQINEKIAVIKYNELFN